MIAILFWWISGKFTDLVKTGGFDPAELEKLLEIGIVGKIENW
jgi:hypothetical protein